MDVAKVDAEVDKNDMIAWNKIRDDYPITKNCIYFESAGMSPLSKSTYNYIVEAYKRIHEFGDVHWQDDLKKYRALQKDLTLLLNTSIENLTFVANSSTAMSLAALSFRNVIKNNFNIVSMKEEFPSSTVPFEYQKIPMKYVEPKHGRYPIQSILDIIDNNTLALVTSHVQSNTGFRQDLEILGKELKKRNILFIVNATQSFPYFSIDVEKMHIDVLCASMHKWGGAGHVGTLFYTSPSFRERFRAPYAGWLSVDAGAEFIYSKKNEAFTIHQSAQMYDVGTFNLQALNALKTSLDYFQKIGYENIRKRIFELSDYLIERLQKLPVEIKSPYENYNERSAIISFSTKHDNKKIVAEFEEKKIYTSLRGGNIRIALNIFNSLSEIDNFMHYLDFFSR